MASGGRAKQLGEAIFKHVSQRRAPSLFKKMLRSLDSGEYHVPKSFQVMSRFPSDELKLHHAPPLRVRLPENDVIKALQQEFPEAKQEPVALSSVKPPLVRQLAWLRVHRSRRRGPPREQTEALDSGSAATAQLQGDNEQEEVLKTRIRALARSADVPSGHLGLLQAEEELQLRAGLDALAGKGDAGVASSGRGGGAGR